MRKFISFALAMLSARASNAHSSDAALLQRYWNYRDRFKKYFVSIGDNQEIKDLISRGPFGFSLDQLMYIRSATKISSPSYILSDGYVELFMAINEN